MKILFHLKGRDVDGSLVTGFTVEEADMPLVPRVDEKVRILGHVCVVNDVEYGRRHDREWGASVYVEVWNVEAEERYDDDRYPYPSADSNRTDAT